MVLNSLRFCLSVKLLISPSYLNEVFAGYSNLGCRFFSFNTLNMSCHFLLQGIFLTQGSNLGLPHSRQMLYCLSHQGSPARISFKYEGEIKSFTDKQNLREISTTKPALQQMLKNVLYPGNAEKVYKLKPKTTK